MTHYVERWPELFVISGQNVYLGAQMDAPMDTSSAVAELLHNATRPPDVAPPVLARLLRDEYGLDGELETLVSERDQNFRLTASDGRRFVVKVANADEDESSAEFQVRAMQYLEQNRCPIPVPALVPTRSGAIAASVESGRTRHRVRLVKYLPGRLLRDVQVDAGLARELGRSLAEIDRLLAGFEHGGSRRPVVWDMQRASEVRGLVGHIADRDLRARVDVCFDEFERHALPAFTALRGQVIHNDLNPDNVLVSESAPVAVAGVIDFGDMLHAPLIVDVAIAASYLRADGEPLALIAALLQGFAGITPLQEAEMAILYELICTRLATTVTLTHWRAAALRGKDDYTRQAVEVEGGAEAFLGRMRAVPAAQFGHTMRCVAGSGS
jgi:hydroxylysine kinase